MQWLNLWSVIYYITNIQMTTEGEMDKDVRESVASEVTFLPRLQASMNSVSTSSLAKVRKRLVGEHEVV